MTTSPISYPSPMATLNLLAPLRQPKQQVIPPRPDIARPTSEQLTQAEEIINATRWLPFLEPLMPHAIRTAQARHLGGRKPEMTLKALLMGCLLLAMMERPLIIRDVQRMLNTGIDAGTKKRLGLDPKREITERMVSSSFNLVAGVINPSAYAESNSSLFDADSVAAHLGIDCDDLDPYEHALFIDAHLSRNRARLDGFIRAGLSATHPLDSKHEGDFALDGSYIPSWERPKTSRRRVKYQDSTGQWVKRPAKPHELSDPDATWWSKKNDGPISKKGRLSGTNDSGLGYLLTALTWAEKDCGPNTRGPDIPNLIEHITVKTARTNGQQEGAHLVETMVAHHEIEDANANRPDRTRGDVLADREYTRVAAWQKRMHQAGFTPHFNLAHEQRGHTNTLGSGVLVIDGLAYSPGIPSSLRHEMSPPVFATRDDRASGAAYFMQRKPYRIRANGGQRNEDGSIKAYCPASNLAGTSLICQNKPASAKGRLDRIQIGTALPVITNSPMPSICAQSSVTISFDELPFWQPHIPGTAEHQWSINRRSLVESAFSRIKDETSQSLRRGQVRLMGAAKMSMAALFYCMAANVVEVARWRLRQAGIFSLDAAREMKTRMPRRHTRNRMQGIARRDEIKRERAAKTLLTELGIAVDLTTGEITESQLPPPTL